MALHVLAYNLTRVMNIMGIQDPYLTAISISQYETTDYRSVKNANKVIIHYSGLRNRYRQNRYEHPP
jgi:hypothetical protein